MGALQLADTLAGAPASEVVVAVELMGARAEFGFNSKACLISCSAPGQSQS